MWQNIIVGLVVALAAASLVWRYLPARWRQKAGQMHPALAPRDSGGCGGCSACAGDSCEPGPRRP